MYRPRVEATAKPTTEMPSFTRAIHAEASRRPATMTAAPIRFAQMKPALPVHSSESRESFHEKVAARKRRHEVPAPPKRNPVSSFARLKWC